MAKRDPLRRLLHQQMRRRVEEARKERGHKLTRGEIKKIIEPLFPWSVIQALTAGAMWREWRAAARVIDGETGLPWMLPIEGGWEQPAMMTLDEIGSLISRREAHKRDVHQMNLRLQQYALRRWNHLFPISQLVLPEDEGKG